MRALSDLSFEDLKRIKSRVFDAVDAIKLGVDNIENYNLLIMREWTNYDPSDIKIRKYKISYNCSSKDISYRIPSKRNRIYINLCTINAPKEYIAYIDTALGNNMCVNTIEIALNRENYDKYISRGWAIYSINISNRTIKNEESGECI